MKLAKVVTRAGIAGSAVTTLVAGAVIVTVLGTAGAQSRRVQVGMLTCSLSSGIGLIVGSQRNVSCAFAR